MTPFTSPDLAATLALGRYQAYSYAYPHKMAYRPFPQPVPVRDVWELERQDALFLYAHIPFCEMRCGFCNLFTMAKPSEALEDLYLDVLERQAALHRDALDAPQFARLAIGGGTPTHFSTPQLDRLLRILERTMGHDAAGIPASVEMSPETLTSEKARLLREFGVDRASIGIQSFLASETKAVRRPQEPEVARQALGTMREAGFETINLDLIYGIENQTPDSFERSIREAIEFSPEEVYLYPLYVRPLTGLGNSPRAWEDMRYALYQRGRDVLVDAGWEQVSMRMFRRRDAMAMAGPVYCCQADGMMGLGAGARSYTSELHYCTEYAVGRRGVVGIIDEFVGRSDAQLSRIDYGTRLSTEDRKRRFVILSLLAQEGLDDAAYSLEFRSQPMDDFPELVQLLEQGLAQKADTTLRLNPDGMSWSDAIGPWLYSEDVRRACAEFDLK